MFRLFNLILIALFFLTTNISNIQAQQRFKAGLVAGLNASQIRGDQTGGYNKLGIMGGLRVNTVLQDKMDVSIELTYSERGSRSSKNEMALGIDVDIKLQYVEVPVLFNYKDWYLEDEDYYKVQGSIGLSYSRLIDVKSEGFTNEHTAQVDNFSQNDVSFVIGAELFATKKISFSARWNTSLNLLFDNEKHSPNLNGLRGYFLSFRVNYML